jgi:hypothetical protein
MKRFILFLLLTVTVVATGIAQNQQELPAFSPFENIPAQPASMHKASIQPFQCPLLLYYQNGPGATYYYHTENVPTSQWAAKLIMPAPATACTVWTVYVDFELLNASAQSKDTIRIFVREVTSPYTQFFSTYFIARPGVNNGFFEIDPPSVAPFNIHSIITNPPASPRNVFVGYQVLGDPSHQVTWKFTTPALYGLPPNSYKFPATGAPIPASTAIGTSVDWVFEARVCCDLPVPVELSAFNAHVVGDDVHFYWRTETETNNYNFELQRASGPNGPWVTRHTLPGCGTSTMPHEYTAIDHFANADLGQTDAPVFWYRLRQRDFDGALHDGAPLQVQVRDLESSGFSLSPGYPNPLSISAGQPANVHYRIARETPVRIVVSDLLGREVAVLVHALLPAGVYQTVWSPESEAGLLPAGTYVMRMQAGTWTGVQKIAVVR